MASGYLIVTQFDVIYDAALRSGVYDDNPKTSEPIYGIPHRLRPILREEATRYRGIDREPLSAVSNELAQAIRESGTPCVANDATILFDEIETTTGREDGWLTEREDVQKVWKALGNDRSKYEVIFGREFDDVASIPEGAEYLGLDTAYFVMDHFSCICDALFIPRWHGTDPEGTLFHNHFVKLNRNGLFNRNEEALEYLRYYLSFDWTERHEAFTAVEVYSVAIALPP